MASLPALDIKRNINHSPHVVLLGAGASLAAFPHGDAGARRLPLMNNLVEVVGLRPLIESFGIDPSIENFEEFYDDLSTSGKHTELVSEIERRIHDYFAAMTLPEGPTIYDYLILCLRKTDFIATFNWDPFLAQAYRRNMHVTEPPRIAFLHGNVAIGVCNEHQRVGFLHQSCSICHRDFLPSRLLYPVKHKDYNSDPFIKGEWTQLRGFLDHAYYVTIFGYSAPETDVEAKRLMLEVWKDNPTRDLAEIDIVDIKPMEYLETVWKEFFVRQHYGIKADIFQTTLLRHPRRSCDAFAMATLQNEPWEENPIPHFDSLKALQNWVKPLIAEEKQGHFSGKPCHKIEVAA
jgi:hypothetical protein